MNKKNCMIGILVVLLFAVAGTVFFVFRMNRQDQNKSNAVKQNEENYLSLSVSDQEQQTCTQNSTRCPERMWRSSR